jgi:hypothetical protein
MERVRMPGSRIVTGSTLHPYGVSASEARFWRVVDTPVGTEHGGAVMWAFADFRGFREIAAYPEPAWGSSPN